LVRYNSSSRAGAAATGSPFNGLVFALNLRDLAAKCYPDAVLLRARWGYASKLSVTVCVAYDGLVFTKPELLSKLNYLDVKHYAMKNFKVRLIGQSGALLTYDLDIQASAAGQHAPRKQYASSVWVREGRHWQLLFHQARPAKH
jgi:hypothetical protein